MTTCETNCWSAPPHPLALLRARREWPRGSRAAEQRDELAAFHHSITSSAATSGFSFIEFGIAGKWLELLKQIAPGVTRVAVLREIPIGLGQLGAIQAVAPSFGVELCRCGDIPCFQ